MNRTSRLADASKRDTHELIAGMRELSLPLRTPEDLDPLLDRIGDARYVLLGEASHGTAEYYLWRMSISQRLIREKGFSFIAVEGDWPDCYRVNRFVKGLSDVSDTAWDVLHAFERWPTWMWANEEVVALTEWLRQHNETMPAGKKIGFYGLDVYSLWESLYTILSYLQRTDSSALPAAWRALRCLEPYGEDVQEYARATMLVPESCEKQVVNLLMELRRKAHELGTDDPEGYFQAEQNALVMKNAESYYRAMVRGGPDSWNIRDHHMTETLERLMSHHGPNARAIVWEHNTHIGDARFTDMAEDDMVNAGQLVREGHEREGVVLVGFGGYQGSVIAGSQWDAPMETMTVPAARAGSWEDILHQARPKNQLLLFSEASRKGLLAEQRGHRAIGVVYHPRYEHLGNYVPTKLTARYDAFLYFDQTEAVHPLHIVPRVEQEAPETYPSGV